MEILLSEIKVLIIGTNDFEDYNFFEEKLYEILGKYFEKDYKIVLREQDSNQVSKFVEKFSKENSCLLEKYPIQWKELGKKAGFENLKKLIWGENGESSVDLLICFSQKWDGEGDKYMMNKIIEEFKSIITLENFGDNLENFFHFIK